jgi:hypothetical protein
MGAQDHNQEGVEHRTGCKAMAVANAAGSSLQTTTMSLSSITGDNPNEQLLYAMALIAAMERDALVNPLNG